MRDGEPESGPSSRALAPVRLGLLALALTAVGAFTLWRGAGELGGALARVADTGWRGAVLFVLLYAVATLALMPGSASTVTAGLLFGPWLGAAVALAGAVVGSSGAYLLARTVGRRPVEVLIRARSAQLDRWIDDRQFRSIVVLRLLPIVPYNLLNYAAGLSPVRLRPFAVGTLVGMTPSALLVARVGSSAREPGSGSFVVSAALLVVATAGSVVAARRWASTHRTEHPDGGS